MRLDCKFTQEADSALPTPERAGGSEGSATSGEVPGFVLVHVDAISDEEECAIV